MDKRTLMVCWPAWNTSAVRGENGGAARLVVHNRRPDAVGIRGFMRVRVVRLVALLAVLTALVPATAGANGRGFTADAPITTDVRTTQATTTQDGNPMIYGIASHAWWLDPEVYGDQLLPALDDLGVT